MIIFVNITLIAHYVCVIKIYLEQNRLQICPYLQYDDIHKFAAQPVDLRTR